VEREPPKPLSRSRIHEVLPLGVKAIDGLLTVGRGQRLGIFAGSGVGKSTLLGMIARNTVADINVITLVGERGREVKDFIEKDLGEAGLKRSILVVATSDQPAMLRLKSAMVGTAIAEYFRDCGYNVLLLMDSLTRFAMAQREIGMAVGEPPISRGFPPSVYSLLPKLLERSGTSDKGSITGLYTVLVEGDDMNEPIADTVRGILDGHIVLSRSLASANHYPAIDILSSVSRVMRDIVSPDHYKNAGFLKNNLAVYRDAKDLIHIGAYKKGSDPEIDKAVALNGPINRFLQQSVEEECTFDGILEGLSELVR
jgi:flagellum-specific ATP synthase